MSTVPSVAIVLSLLTCREPVSLGAASFSANELFSVATFCQSGHVDVGWFCGIIQVGFPRPRRSPDLHLALIAAIRRTRLRPPQPPPVDDCNHGEVSLQEKLAKNLQTALKFLVPGACIRYAVCTRDTQFSLQEYCLFCIFIFRRAVESYAALLAS